MALLEYRLVVRNQTDTADLLDVSTRRGASQPYLEGPPSGDGTEFDPISGRSRSGAFSGTVLDPITSGTSRLITSLLEDTTGRPQFAALKATWYYAEDGGSWQVLFPGIVSSIRTNGGIGYEITVADVTLAERKATAFAPQQGETIADYLARWPIRGCVVGGIRSADGTGFLSFPDLGGWELTADRSIDGGTTVYYKFNAGYAAPEFVRKTDSWGLGVPSNEAAGEGTRARVIDSLTLPAGGFVYPKDAQVGPWSGMVAEVRNATTGATFYGMPQRGLGGGVKFEDSGRLVQDTGERRGLFVSGVTPANIAIGTRVRIRYFDILPSERSPIYWTGHPADLLAALWAEAGFAYSASAITTLKGTLGTDLRLSIAVTQTEDLSAFLERTIYAPFGVSVRANTSGELEPFCTRVAFGAVPSRTIDDDDVACGDDGSPEGTAYDLDIGQAITRVTFEYHPLVKDLNVPPAPDGIARHTLRIERDSEDPYRVGQKEQSFSIPGQIHHASQQDGEAITRAWVDTLAHELFDRFGRGAMTAEAPLLGGGSGDGILLGEEIYDARPQTPNANKRQGDDAGVSARIGQVVRVTPTVTGPVVKLIDSGFWGQAPSTLPTFTLAQSATYPQSVAEVTITNAATLTAASYHVRVQMAVGAAPAATAYTDAAYFRAGEIPTGAFQLPAVAPGSVVWVRMRSEKTGGRPSNWQTADDVNLDGLAAPSALTVTPDAADGTRATAEWTNGESDAPVAIYLREGSGEDVRYDVLPAGSTRYTFDRLEASTAYTAGVEHVHPTTGDPSTRAEDGFTTSAVAVTLVAPEHPQGFSLPGGVYGIAVDAEEDTARVEVAEAVETAVGSGVYGSYTTLGDVAVVLGEWTAFATVAPNDGLRRKLKARHTKSDGALVSSYTSEVTVTPWTYVPLPDYLQLTGEFGPSLTVTPTPGASTYSIAYTASGGTVELSIDGATYSTAPSSPIIVTRPSAGSPSKTYAFRITANGQTIANEVSVPAVDKDTITPDLTVVQSNATATTVQLSATATNPAGGAAPSMTITLTGCTSTASSLLDGVEYPWLGNPVVIDRPAFGTTTQAYVTVKAAISGGGSETIQRTVQNQVKTTFGPTLTVTPTPGASTYSIAYTASGGAVELSIDGAAYSTAPASPISVTRPTAGSPSKSYAFRITADGQTIANEVTVPAVDKDTVTPDLQVVPWSATDTYVQYRVFATNPAGGAAPTMTVRLNGTTGENNSTVLTYAADTDYTITTGHIILALRPAFGTTSQASITFSASLPGGGSEVIQRTVQNQVKTSFGPTLEVTPTPSSGSYSIAYSSTGTVTLSINGGAYSSPAASPIVVTRTSSDQVYVFKATLDGQTITQEVAIPAAAGTTTPLIHSLGLSRNDLTDQLTFGWSSNGSINHFHYEWEEMWPGSQSGTGSSSSPVSFFVGGYDLDAAGSETTTVRARVIGHDASHNVLAESGWEDITFNYNP